MQLTRLLRKNPRMIAEQLIEAIDKEEANIDSIEIAGPGFINMFMKKDALTSIIKEVLAEKDDYGKSDAGKGIKYNVEFVSANPTGDLHLGHAKGAAVGDSICRIMSAAGYDVTREYYINDAGNQIYNLALSLYARYREAFGLDFELPEDGYHGQDIKDIAVKIKEEVGDKYLNADHDEMIAFFRKEGTKFELQKIKDILAEFRVHHDVWFSETSLYEENKVVPTIEKLKENLNNGIPARAVECNEDEQELVKDMFLLTSKPVIYIANVSEEQIENVENDENFKKVKEYAKNEKAEVVPICVKIEEELSSLEDEDKKEMLDAIGLKESGLDVLIKKSYDLLGLMSFLTAGEPEVRAWTIKKGTKAPQAAGKIHSDIERGFIKAEVVSFEDLIKEGSMTAAKEKGLVRSEGKEYIMQDGDIVLFKFNV